VHHLRRDQEREDLRQETVPRVLVHVGRFRPQGRGSFDSWVSTIALHLWASNHRSMTSRGLARRPAAAAGSRAPGLLNEVADRELAHRLASRLDPRIATALMSGDSLREIARDQGVTETTVRRRLEMARGAGRVASA